ncbi:MULTISPECIES: hypothetical protein [unclassified Bifidobacterium]|uniref:hypothetical protein n=1 Tax=unclassified Bifidobacterium TaxID=2608897 RepID=UPI00112E8513|nr:MULTISPECIES: hypothetical protein [unclassified Bifidobacterium]
MIKKVVKQFAHPYLSLIAFIIGTTAIVEFINYQILLQATEPSTKELVFTTALLITTTIIIVYYIRYPISASYAVLWITALGETILDPAPLSLLVLGISAIAVSTYSKPLMGYAMAILYAFIMILDGIIRPTGIMGAGSAYTFVAFIIIGAGIGHGFRINAQHIKEHQKNITLQHNMQIARELHDHTTNDLTNIIMIINKRLEDNNIPITDKTLDNISNRTKDLLTIRDLAANALQHTRQSITTLDSTFTLSDTKSTQIHTSQNNDKKEKLIEEEIEEQKNRIENVGYHGEIITIGNMDTLPEHIQRFLIDFIHELFGNITKHSDPKYEYTLIISTTNNQVILELSDHPAHEPIEKMHMKGMNSGLKRYSEIITAMNGTLEVRTKGIWSIQASIPF